MSEKTGGPAFPFTGDWEGMTLRDYFAAKAMGVAAKNISTPQSNIDSLDHWRSCVASSAYRLADAMLRAREVKP